MTTKQDRHQKNDPESEAGGMMTIRVRTEPADAAQYGPLGRTVPSRSLSATVARMATPPTTVLALLFVACAGTGQSSRGRDPATRIRRDLVDQHLAELVAKFDQALAAHEAAPPSCHGATERPVSFIRLARLR